ncbi:MAG TPA: flavodoxin domain-containing protein [Jatrophihabitans sp.]|nr:flavodoxin domain-containing protein [Jatrophihabitans sp.]
MFTLVVYESMYGNTRQLAEAIAAGARTGGEAETVPVSEVNPDGLEHVGLLVVGAPTHAWGLPRPSTRHAAANDSKAGSPPLEPHAQDPGVRELLARLPELECPAAAFDTRLDAPAAFTGRAGRAIAKGLRRRGASLVDRPRSFLVGKQNTLRSGQLEQARAWGERLVSQREALVGKHH